MTGTEPEKPAGMMTHMAEWIDGKLLPTLGPPPIGPYDEEPERTTASCPICVHPMSEHTIDRSTSNTVLHCPVPMEPKEQSFEPLNEVGMRKAAPEPEGQGS